MIAISQHKHNTSATLAAVVSQIHSDKRSVEIRLLNCKGWIPCGHVTIPCDFQIPKVGQVVEIHYLHAIKETNVLCEPVYMGARKDIERHECGISQLRYKGGGDPKPE